MAMLNGDVVCRIFIELRPQEICIAGRVCKPWYVMATYNNFWKDVFIKYVAPARNGEHENWKALTFRMHKLLNTKIVNCVQRINILHDNRCSPVFKFINHFVDPVIGLAYQEDIEAKNILISLGVDQNTVQQLIKKDWKKYREEHQLEVYTTKAP